MFLQGSLFSIASSSNFFRLVHNNSSSEGNTALGNFQFSLLLLILLICGGGGRCSTQRLHDRRHRHPFCWPWCRDRWGIGIGIGVARGGSRSNGKQRLALWPRCRDRWWSARGRRYSHSFRCEALKVVLHSLGTHVRLVSPISVMPVHHVLRGPNTPIHGSLFGPF